MDKPMDLHLQQKSSRYAQPVDVFVWQLYTLLNSTILLLSSYYRQVCLLPRLGSGLPQYRIDLVLTWAALAYLRRLDYENWLIPRLRYLQFLHVFADSSEKGIPLNCHPCRKFCILNHRSLSSIGRFYSFFQTRERMNNRKECNISVFKSGI